MGFLKHALAVGVALGAGTAQAEEQRPAQEEQVPCNCQDWNNWAQDVVNDFALVSLPQAMEKDGFLITMNAFPHIQLHWRIEEFGDRVLVVDSEWEIFLTHRAMVGPPPTAQEN